MQRVVRMGSRPPLLRELPAPLQKLIEQCWDRNPLLRPTCSEILELLDAARQMVVDDNNNNNNNNNNNDGLLSSPIELL